MSPTRYPQAHLILWMALNAFPQGLPLDRLIQLGMEKNPELLLSRQESSTASDDTLTASLRSNPVLEMEALHNLEESGKPKAGIKISQEFQPGVLDRKISLARGNWAARQEWVNVRAREVAGEIRADFFDWQILNRKRALQREVQTRWENLSRLAAAKVAEGRLSQVEQAQAQLNRSRAKQRELEIKGEMEALEMHLAYLTGWDRLPDSLQTMSMDSLPALLPLDSVMALARVESPEIKAWGREVAAQNERLALERNLRNPSFSLSLGYERETEGENLVGGGIGIPLPLFNRNQAGIITAKSRLRESELRRKAGEHRLKSDIAAIHGKLVTLAARYRNYAEEIRDLGGKQLALSEKGFRQGLLGLFDLSRVQEESLTQDLEALDILQEYYRLWSRLEKLAGGGKW
jgi:outer membrane protein, heavy metal efflux system